jgi:hypothetical protein
MSEFWNPIVLSVWFAFAWPGPAAEPVGLPAPSVQPVPADSPANPASYEPARPALLEWHDFKLFPRATAAMVYDDNITIQPVNRQADLIWSFSPGATLMAGSPGVDIAQGTSFETLRMLGRQPYLEADAQPAKLFLVDYAPNFRLFTSHDQYSGVDESALLTAVYSLARLTLGLDQDYVKLLSAVNDVGTLTEVQTLKTRVTAKYDLSDRTSLEVNGQYLNTSYPSNNLFGSRQWVNQDWLNRKLFSQVTAGLGLDLEYWDIDRNSSQTSEQALARAIYWLASKLELTVSAGPEWRQYEGNAPATLEPVFNLAGTFYPRDSTTVTLEGHRLQQPSAYAGADFIVTGFSLALRQRLAARWTVAVTSGYDQVQYRATAAPGSVSRADDSFSAKLGLDYRFSGRWMGGVFYRHREDLSNQGAIGFQDNQAGVQVCWRF